MTARESGSYLPLGDRQACLPGGERANIRYAKFPSLTLAPLALFSLSFSKGLPLRLPFLF
jgi:hypothetical protein